MPVHTSKHAIRTRSTYGVHNIRAVPVMDGFLRRLIGDRRPDDEATLGVGLGGVFAGLLPLPPFVPPPLTVSLLAFASASAVALPPLLPFFAGDGVMVVDG